MAKKMAGSAFHTSEKISRKDTEKLRETLCLRVFVAKKRACPAFYT
ncbi:Uncharacterized protein dnm_002550 [Desulfonema magnum]|uniref:Uncharacterized protein n=1 Tax=Desulfonema magnum TaxID=45655 RepID=A0A975BF64_9BACT|nr:Uncharacterized protein dnm_002550 [Desulfonema magnum]